MPTYDMGTDEEMRPGESFPVMYCRKGKLPRDGTLVWEFWCPNCRCWHIHSAAPGHRAAHCHDRAPPFEDGYVLALDPRRARKQATEGD
jgi:hypothetical protein